MCINALLLHAEDNVVTCVKNVIKGETVFYRSGDSVCSLIAEEDIPYCHKIALKDFSEGEAVNKYGEPIGLTNEPIKKGHWVSHRNIHSVFRDYESEKIKI